MQNAIDSHFFFSLHLTHLNHITSLHSTHILFSLDSFVFTSHFISIIRNTDKAPYQTWIADFPIEMNCNSSFFRMVLTSFFLYFDDVQMIHCCFTKLDTSFQMLMVGSENKQKQIC